MYGHEVQFGLSSFDTFSFQLVTGGVQSNISRQMHLPDNSLYKPVERILREKRVGVSQGISVLHYFLGF